MPPSVSVHPASPSIQPASPPEVVPEVEPLADPVVPVDEPLLPEEELPLPDDEFEVVELVLPVELEALVAVPVVEPLELEVGPPEGAVAPPQLITKRSVVKNKVFILAFTSGRRPLKVLDRNDDRSDDSHHNRGSKEANYTVEKLFHAP